MVDSRRLTDEEVAESHAMLKAFDTAWESQQPGAADAKLIVLANYGDLAIAHLRALLSDRAALTAQLADEPYLVWSNQHRAWWKPDRHGYTKSIKLAGIYTAEEARSISFMGRDGWFALTEIPDEIAVPLSSIPPSSAAHIRALTDKGGAQSR